MSHRDEAAKNGKLQKAIAALTIQDVSFEKFNCSLLNNFDPRFDDRSELLSYQTRVNVIGFEVIETRYQENNEDASAELETPIDYTLRVSVSLGIRLGEKGKLSQAETDPQALAIIEGTMAAYYDIHDKAIIEDTAAIEDFALKNAVFHVWPYWREFASSSLQRLNLKKITLPFMKQASNRNAGKKKVIDRRVNNEAAQH